MDDESGEGDEEAPTEGGFSSTSSFNNFSNSYNATTANNSNNVSNSSNNSADILPFYSSESSSNYSFQHPYAKSRFN